MFNYSKLLGKIKEKGFTQEMLASAINISSVTLNKKLNNESEFKGSEMRAILSVLGEGLDKLSVYFFDTNL